MDNCSLQEALRKLMAEDPTKEVKFIVPTGKLIFGEPEKQVIS